MLPGGLMEHAPHVPALSRSAGWVDEALLAGNDSDCCLRLGRAVHRGTLRDLVAEQQHKLGAAGLTAGGTVSLRLPPSPGDAASLLAAWRTGAQVTRPEHPLPQDELDRALERPAPQRLGHGPRTSAPAARALAR